MSDNTRLTIAWLLCLTALVSPACRDKAATGNPRVSGQVEATEVQVAPEVGGRVLDIPVAEGNRAKKGDVMARLDTRDVDLALQRAQADRAAADAQLRLLQAGSRPEDIRQAEAQAMAAASEVTAAQSRPRVRREGPSALRAAVAEQLRLAEAAGRCRDAKRCGERSRGVGAGARRCGARSGGQAESGRPPRRNRRRARAWPPPMRRSPRSKRTRRTRPFSRQSTAL